MGDPGPEVGRAQAGARRLAALGHHGVPVGPAVLAPIWIGVDSNGDGTTGSDRPNISGGCGVSWDDDHRGFTNDACYTAPLGTNNLPLQNGLGNGSAPRNGERGAGYWNTDMSLLKRFYVFGDRQLHIRADAFNIFNQDNYGIPVSNMNSVSFGQNTNNWGRRIVTLSAKFSF